MSNPNKLPEGDIPSPLANRTLFKLSRSHSRALKAPTLPLVNNPSPPLRDNPTRASCSMAGSAVSWSRGVTAVVSVRGSSRFRDIESGAVTGSDLPLLNDERGAGAGTSETHDAGAGGKEGF
jgi:hypothetical protein